jgi:aspartate aminotransferase
MSIARKIKSSLKKGSLIREMFEKGAQLKNIHGEENVFDFSIGSPNLPPPSKFYEALEKAVSSREKGIHGYMPNCGYLGTRKAVADCVSRENRVSVTTDEVIMTCGAAGGLNVVFKTLLNTGDEVIVPSPYFVEYDYYVDNHNGVLKPVETNPDFTLSLDAIRDAVTTRTKAVLINSPNNPTGQIYSQECLKTLGDMLAEKSEEIGSVIYLISDEPYRKIVFDGVVVPSILDLCRESIVVTSYSKDLSIPGERIGYIVVNPAISDKVDLLSGMTFANRILGFVNSPALMQRAIASVQDVTVDMNEYARKRGLFCDVLNDCGYDFLRPPGTFYLFPKSPLPNDLDFVKALQKEMILAVPGSAFGAPGYFRLVFCVDDSTIINSKAGFKRVMESLVG